MSNLPTLVIPDIHEAIDFVLAALEIPHSSVVFLGDWFDRFPSQKGDKGETLEWLQKNYSNPKYTFLYGNHDLHYTYDNWRLCCSGYSPETHKMIWNSEEPIFRGFKYYHWVGKWLLSHAGVHESLFTEKQIESKSFDDVLWYQAAKAEKGLSAPDAKVSPWLSAGRCRGGQYEVGGITWLDWEMEFEPIRGLDQIVGHSMGRGVRESDGMSLRPQVESWNFCIDSREDVALIGEDGEVEFRKVKGWGYYD